MKMSRAQTVKPLKLSRIRMLPIRFRPAKLITYLILAGWTVFGAYAIGWIVLASLSKTGEIFRGTLLATGLHFETYYKALYTQNMALYFVNSAIYVLSAILLIIVISAPAAYVLSRAVFRGRGFLYSMLIAGQGVPGVMLLIPIYILTLKLSLAHSSGIGLIIVYVTTSIPFSVYFLSSFFASLPKELEEAARIDGCTDIEAFWKIMLPLAQPGIITVSVFQFMNLWNEYFWAITFVNTDERRTLALGLQALIQAMQYTGDWAGMFAAVVIVFVPTFILYLFLSEKIIAGITIGAVK
jgi:N-acetylglucosamine transport system permease protein